MSNFQHVRGPDPTLRHPGKWLLYVSRAHVTTSWRTVAEATTAGILGPATKRSNSGGDPEVFMVYTADWHDEEDVRRVLRGLRTLGWSRSLSYKRDEETTEAVYGAGSSFYVSPYEDVLDPASAPARQRSSMDAPSTNEHLCSRCFVVVPAATLNGVGQCPDCE